MRSVAVSLVALAAAATVVIACADDREQHDPAQANPPGTLPSADPSGRAVVATVNGRPVYDDCVAAQAAASPGHDDRPAGERRRAALEECIDIELLAQAAEARGLVAEPEVKRVREVELVRRYIDREFVARYPDWQSVDRDLLQRIYDHFKARYVHPELRETSFLRAVAAIRTAPAGSPEDLAAQRAMTAIYEAVSDQRDLSFEDLQERAQEVVEAQGISVRIERDDVTPFHRGSSIVEPYKDATFAIPAAGMVSPPVRTEWGWDIILLRKIYPARDTPLTGATDELFPLARRQLYQQWVESLLTSSPVARGPITIHDDTLAALQAADDARRFDPRAQPR